MSYIEKINISYPTFTQDINNRPLIIYQGTDESNKLLWRSNMLRVINLYQHVNIAIIQPEKINQIDMVITQ